MDARRTRGAGSGRCRPDSAVGRASLLGLLAVAVVGTATPARGQETQVDPGPDARAEELIDRWIRAAGGMDRYHELERATFTVTTELYDTATGRLRRARPRYITIGRSPAGEMSRVERWEGDDFIQHGWDGRSAWAFRNGEELGPGDPDFDEARYVAADVQYWISLPYELRDPGVDLHHDGTDEEGREVVRVTFGEGVGDRQDVWRYRFAPDETVWPVQVESIEEGVEPVSRLRFEDIREVDGYVFVGRRVHFDERGRVTKVLATEDFRFNPDVDAEVFSGR
ncbi:MAG: hypothetical protein PVI57_14160 [Gemmatimonadota bacterium]|jgi:hypothetical protein